MPKFKKNKKAMTSPYKMVSPLKQGDKMKKKKSELGAKKIKTSLAHRKKGYQGYEVTYSDGTKKKVLRK